MRIWLFPTVQTATEQVGSEGEAMSSVFRRVLVIGAGAALLVGLTAGTLSAASSTKKTYSVDVSTVQIVNSSATSFTAELHATYTNTTPGGISSFNSILLTVPTGYQIDVTKPATFTTTTGSSAGTPSTSATTITVTNLYPVSYNRSVTLDFWATIPIAATCSTATWTTQAFTGSNLSGTLFTPTFSTNVNTSLYGGSTTGVNGVSVTNTSADTTACVPVTVTKGGNAVQILKPNSGVPLTVTIDWTFDPPVSPLPWTKVSDTYNPNLHNIEWCGGTQSAPALPGDGEVSCLVSENSQIAGSNTVNVEDVIYLLGDWGAAKG